MIGLDLATCPASAAFFDSALTCQRGPIVFKPSGLDSCSRRDSLPFDPPRWRGPNPRTFMRRPQPDSIRHGQESVWSFPRPAVAQSCAAHIVIEHRGAILADTRRAVRVVETSHPPSYYIPPDDILAGALHPARGSSLCEWKGAARYWDVTLGEQVLPRVGWSYPDPTPDFRLLKDHIAFYAAPFDRCSVDGERVIPQPGGFYGGWITSAVAGPFKGIPGSEWW